MRTGAAVAIGLAGGLVLGLAGGWLLADRDPAAPGRATGEIRALVPAPSGGEARASDPPRGVTVRAYADSIESYVDEVGPEAEAPHPGPAAGTLPAEHAARGTIEGRVRDQLGRPLAGAEIWASPVEVRDPELRPVPAWREGDGPPPLLDLREQVRAFVAEELARRERRCIATTDASGRFRLERLGALAYRLEAYARGYRLQPAGPTSPRRVPVGSSIEFLAARVVPLRVEVRLPVGDPAPTAWIQSDGNSAFDDSGWGGGSIREPWSPERPVVHVPPGLHRFFAVGGSRDELQSERIAVDLTAGAEPAPLVFVLQQRTGITGRVKAGAAWGGTPCRVHALAFERGAPADEELIRSGNGNWFDTLEAGGSRFEFLDIPPGDYRVGVVFDDRVETSTVVRVAKGRLEELELVVPDPPLDRGLRVRVLGPDGLVLPSARVWIQGESDEIDMTGWRWRYQGEVPGLSVRRRPDGDHAVIEAAGFVLAAPLLLFAMVPGFGVRCIRYPGSGAGSAVLRFEHPGVLEAVVEGLSPENREHISVILHGAGGEIPRSLSLAAWPQDGRVIFSALQPGGYDVVLAAQGVLDTQRSRRVTVVSGTNTLALASPGVYTLTVHFPGSILYEEILASRVDEEGQQLFAEFDAGARIAVFSSLFPGEYRISAVHGAGRDSMVVRVVSSARVEFRPAVQTAVRVHRIEENAVLARSGLESGDLIIAAGGIPFTGERPALTVLRGAFLTSGRVALGVRRRGELREIVVEGDGILPLLGQDRHFEPVSP
jgi:hypothetical protein